MSLRSTFEELCGSGSAAPVFSNAPNEYIANKKLVRSHSGYDLYAGHYGYDVYRKLADGHSLVTNFRDPVKRVYSLYRYWRHSVPLDSLSNLNHNDREVIRLAHILSFSEFIRADSYDLRLYISNFHFRQIYRSGWDRSSAGLLPRWVVKRRIAKMPWFYVAEMPEVSALLLRHCFPQLNETVIPWVNRSGGESEIMGRLDAQYLVSLNILDYEIYSFAVKVMVSRLRRLSQSV